jgi:hypothetical protein
MIFIIPSFACPVCEKQQPDLLKGIAHGSGPQSDWDYVIVFTTVIIVAATLFYSIKWIIRPGEKEKEHIKRSILNFE